MKYSISLVLGLLSVRTTLADTAIDGSWFTDNDGIQAAQAAAPMWYMPSGTCMPSAAEDGEGNQTNGVDPDLCNPDIDQLYNGCPPQPEWTGANTWYGNITGEPFVDIPTYYAHESCSDGSWKTVYYVYFKKDTGHKSDWEGVVLSWKNIGNDQWVRDYVKMEQDGNHVTISYDEINDTFSGTDDWENFAVQNLDHPKFYFGKFHHSVHDDWYTAAFKNTCPPDSAVDYRNDDYQFWAYWNLRPTSVLNPDWVWGQADPPNSFDYCTY